MKLIPFVIHKEEQSSKRSDDYFCRVSFQDSAQGNPSQDNCNHYIEENNMCLVCHQLLSSN